MKKAVPAIAKMTSAPSIRKSTLDIAGTELAIDSIIMLIP